MDVPCIDTNVVIDFLVKSESNPEFHTNAVGFLNHASESKMYVYLPESCLAEVIFVLTSTRGQFRFARERVAIGLISLLKEYPIRMTDKRVMIEALSIFGKFNHLDFADSIIVANRRLSANKQIYSRDTDFDMFEGLERIEPASLTQTFSVAG